MFVEWESNSGKLQIISEKFQNNAINKGTSSKFHSAMWLRSELINFYSPRNHPKTMHFPMIPGGIEVNSLKFALY